MTEHSQLNFPNGVTVEEARRLLDGLASVVFSIEFKAKEPGIDFGAPLAPAYQDVLNEFGTAYPLNEYGISVVRRDGRSGLRVEMVDKFGDRTGVLLGKGLPGTFRGWYIHYYNRDGQEIL